MSALKPSRSALKKSLYRCITAGRAFDQVRTICEFLRGQKIDERQPMYVPLMTAVCVMYGRPFSANKEMGPLPAKYGKFETNSLQPTHDTLISSRNELYAHSDLSLNVVEPSTGQSEPLHQLLISSKHEQKPHGVQISYHVGVSELNLTRVNIPKIILACEDLQKRLNQEIGSLIELLFRDSPMKPGLHKLRLDDES